MKRTLASRNLQLNKGDREWDMYLNTILTAELDELVI